MMGDDDWCGYPKYATRCDACDEVVVRGVRAPRCVVMFDDHDATVRGAEVDDVDDADGASLVMCDVRIDVVRGSCCC